MSATLFTSFMELCLSVIVAFTLYQIFVSDWVEEKRAQWKEGKNKVNTVDKIAQIKLVSDDAKGIEDFVTKNAQYLSDQMVKKLVSRIEDIKAGSVIAADEILKTRIAELPQEKEEDAKTIRSQRTRN